MQRRQGEGGRGVPSARLKCDLHLPGAHLPYLLGHQEAVFLIGDHQRRHCAGARMQATPVEAQQGVLQQGVLADQGEQLLRILLARQGPQTAARTPTENDGEQVHLISS